MRFVLVALLFYSFALFESCSCNDEEDNASETNSNSISNSGLETEFRADDQFANNFYLQSSGQVTLTGVCPPSVASLRETLQNTEFSDSDCSDGNWALSPITVQTEGIRIRIEATLSSGETQSFEKYIGSKAVIGYDQRLQSYPGLENGTAALHAAMSANSTSLFLADSTNNRVLVWNTAPSTSRAAPDYVIGQPSLSNNKGDVSELYMNAPSGVHATDSVLVVADTLNHRVLVWSPIPTESGVSADLVLGQADFTSNAPNRGGSIAANTMNTPQGVWTDGTVLYVVDNQNNRILIWDNLSTLVSNSNHGEPADAVIGQTNFTNGTASTSDSRLRFPSDVHYDAANDFLIVADRNNHRVVAASAATPPTTSVKFTIALGQPDLTTTGPNTGGLSATSLESPIAIETSGTNLFVNDRNNNRVKIYDLSSLSTNMAASTIVGQGDATSEDINGDGSIIPNSQFLRLPQAAVVLNSRLYIYDFNYRILFWNTVPSLDGADSNGFLLTTSTTTRFANAIAPTASTVSINSRNNVLVHQNNILIVCDRLNKRLLLYDIRQNINEPIDVFGQDDFNSSVAYDSASRSNSGECVGIHSDGQRLLSIDRGFNRLLIWNAVPTTEFGLPDLVIGQPDFDSSTPGLDASTFDNPGAAFVLNNQLFVSDQNNNRVLVWNTFPTANGQAADSVLFQTDFTSNVFGSSSTKARAPNEMFYSGGQFFITDNLNRRILVWDGIPAQGEAADYVIAQHKFDVVNAGLSNKRIETAAEGGVIRGSRFYIHDRGNNRYMGYDLPYQIAPNPGGVADDTPPAQVVYGQKDFDSNFSNYNGFSEELEGEPYILNEDPETGYQIYFNSGFRLIIQATR